MRRIFITLIALFILFTSHTFAQSQSIWKHFSRPDYGTLLHMYNYEETTRPLGSQSTEGALKYSVEVLHVGSIIGVNLPVVSLAEHLSVGVNPNLALSLGVPLSSFSRAESIFLALELPWYATIKYGTDASYKGSRFPVGVTAGIGYHYSLLKGLGTEFSPSFGRPSVMAEINFGKRNSKPGLVKLRYIHDIGTYEEDYSTSSASSVISMSRWGIHLVFVAGY